MENYQNSIPNQNQSFGQQSPLQSSPFSNIPFPKKSHNKIVLSVIIIALMLGLAAFVYLKLGNKQEQIEQEPVSSVEPTANLGQKTPSLRSHVIATIPSDLNTRFNYYREEKFVFNGVGDEVMYTAQKKNTPDTILLMKNQDLVGEFLSLDALEPSGDGQSINYSGLKKFDQGGQVIVNGVWQVGAPAQGTRVVFSKEGKHYAYVAFYKGGVAVLHYDNQPVYEGGIPVEVRNGKAQTSSYISLSPSMNSIGTGLAMVSQVGLKKQAVIANITSKQIHLDDPFDDILSEIVFSPDGLHWAYRAIDKDKEFIVVDGKPRSSFKNSGTAWEPVFSLDSNEIAYSTSRSTSQSENINTGSIIPYVQENYISLLPSVARSDSLDSRMGKSETVYDQLKKNSAYIAVNYESSNELDGLDFYIYVNNIKLNEAFDYIATPTFDSTGQYVMFGAREGNQLTWNVYKIDGQKLVRQ